MSFAPREYLRHIADEAGFLEHATSGVSRAAFLEDPTLQRACVRSFEIIGEATKKIPAELRSAHPDVAWYKVEAENYESIHNHNAYACIEKG